MVTVLTRYRLKGRATRRKEMSCPLEAVWGEVTSQKLRAEVWECATRRIRRRRRARPLRSMPIRSSPAGEPPMATVDPEYTFKHGYLAQKKASSSQEKSSGTGATSFWQKLWAAVEKLRGHMDAARRPQA
jgi:hypothetical protein